MKLVAKIELEDSSTPEKREAAGIANEIIEETYRTLFDNMFGCFNTEDLEYSADISIID